MPNRPIISIEVNDQQFKDFTELFAKHQEKLDAVPKQWAAVGAAADASSDAMAGAIGALTAGILEAGDHARKLAQHLRSAGEAQKQFGTSSRQGAKNLKDMASDAKTLGDRVFGIGKFLFKLGAIGGIGGGLLGGFGLDKLANSAVSNQRNARTLGMTTGQYRAFGTDLAPRIVDPGTLDSVAAAKSDLSKQWALTLATGLSGSALQNADPGTLAAKMALKAHDWYTQHPGQNAEQYYTATGLGQAGFDYESARRAGNTPRSEIVAMTAKYATDSKQLNLSNKVVDGLFSFQNQLRMAGQALETSFSKHLSDLGPSLGGLVKALEKDAEILINDIFTAKNVAAIESGIDTFVKYLGSQEFKDSVQSLMSGLGSLAKLIEKLFPGTTGSSGANPAPSGSDPTTAGISQSTWAAQKYNDILAGKSHIAGPDSFVAHMLRSFALSGGVDPAMLNEPAQFKKLFPQIEAANGLPTGILSSLASVESGFKSNALSPKGAQGLFQLMPQVSRALGVQNPNDPIQSAMGGATLFKQLQKQYGGDLKKELAAWNWGSGNLDEDIKNSKKNGTHWEDHLPTETQNFIQRVMRDMQQANRPVQVNVTVTNKSGANVAVSANAGSIH